jgi:hypothetical protein
MEMELPLRYSPGQPRPIGSMVVPLLPPLQNRCQEPRRSRGPRNRERTRVLYQELPTSYQKVLVGRLHLRHRCTATDYRLQQDCLLQQPKRPSHSSIKQDPM